MAEVVTETSLGLGSDNLYLLRSHNFRAIVSPVSRGEFLAIHQKCKIVENSFTQSFDFSKSRGKLKKFLLDISIGVASSMYSLFIKKIIFTKTT